MENSMQIPQKIKNGITIWSSNHITLYFPKEYENTDSKRYMHPYIRRSIIYHSQNMDATQVSLNKWMDKDVVWDG